jgi:DNA polymerase IIIc chi subunit
MTEVTFHFNAADKLGHACRVLRKAVASGAKVVVTGDTALLRELDVALWTFAALEFVPHCLGSAATPAVLAAWCWPNRRGRRRTSMCCSTWAARCPKDSSGSNA